VLTAVLVLLPYPVACVIPLLVLVATFEAIRPLHFGAERIGRYLQVFYEEDGDAARPLADIPSWERTAMRLGAVPGVGGHPLFVPVFLMATLINLLPILVAQPAALPIELAAFAVPHAAFAAWALNADRAMRTQRARDLTQLRALREDEEGIAQGRR
jgi:hypothetical protein